MGVTFEVQDPVTGEKVLMHAYFRDGRVRIRRLPRHLLLEYATPRRIEHIERFARAAQTAYNASGLIGGLPPAAAAVRRAFSQDANSERRAAPSGEVRVDAVRDLLPKDQLARIEALAMLPSHVRLLEPIKSKPRNKLPR